MQKVLGTEQKKLRQGFKYGFNLMGFKFSIVENL